MPSRPRGGGVSWPPSAPLRRAPPGREPSSPRTNQPVSRVGFGYAALWFVVVGARTAFSYGWEHWFATQLGHWMITNQVTVDAITDALIMMAVAMTLTRPLGLVGRASGVRCRVLSPATD